MANNRNAPATGNCVWCGIAFKKQRHITRDHVIPRMFFAPGAVGNFRGNIQHACKRCNGERGRIHDFYRLAASIDPEDSSRWPCCIRFHSRLNEMTALYAHWERIETQALGWSFTATLKLLELPIFADFRQIDFEKRVERLRRWP